MTSPLSIGAIAVMVREKSFPFPYVLDEAQDVRARLHHSRYDEMLAAMKRMVGCSIKWSRD